MIRKVTASILFLLMIFTSLYLKSQIDAFNMDFYSGKDNGAFVQLESILIFSFVFFALISRRNKILYGFLGLIVGVVSSVILSNFRDGDTISIFCIFISNFYILLVR